MNVELTVERVAGNWAARGEVNAWAENAMDLESTQGETTAARQKVAVLWRENNFTVPLRRVDARDQDIAIQFQSRHEVQL